MTVHTFNRCELCGRFMPFNQPGSSWVYVPDSYMSYEEIFDRCRRCTEKHGPCRSQQNVRQEMCTGVRNLAETTK